MGRRPGRDRRRRHLVPAQPALGADGCPAAGEEAAAGRLTYRVPDLDDPASAPVTRGSAPPFTLRRAPGRPGTAAEQATRRTFAMYPCWLAVERRYDDTGLARLGLACPPRLIIGHDDVLADRRHGPP
ncbi:hypothetical protein [Streptomyces sp. NBC_01803]|uniref:hypothetical protein n=1 Tax=Streptomyces sp. NBC_01803 TaxID=2975946 RepID=UPI003FA3567B